MSESRFSQRSVTRFTNVYLAMLRNEPTIRISPKILGLNPQVFIARCRDGKKAIADGLVTLPGVAAESLVAVWPNYKLREVNNAVEIARNDQVLANIEDSVLTVDSPDETDLGNLCRLRSRNKLPAPIRLTNVPYESSTIIMQTLAQQYDILLQEVAPGTYLLF